MFKSLDHVGIIVDDLAEAKRFYERVLGLKLVRELDAPERNLKAAFYSLGNTQVELIEVTHPVDRGMRLGNASARIEHLAVIVDDVDVAAAELADSGVRMQTEEPVVMGNRRMYFSVPETCDGVTYQLIQPL